jgi:curved DNA-binding protein CbpA
MMDQWSPYQILKIRIGATQEEIRNAYRRLAMKYHPDRNPEDPEAEEKFKEVQRAYETLSRGRRLKESHPINTSLWGFDDPFSDFSDPFFNFYMLAKKNTSSTIKKKNGSRRRGAAKGTNDERSKGISVNALARSPYPSNLLRN